MITRVKLEVWVNLDPTPGRFHSKESAKNVISGILLDRLGHYNPMVSVTSDQNEYEETYADRVVDAIKNPSSEELLGREIDRIANEERLTEAERWDDDSDAVDYLLGDES